ncbi:GNAT family N-acetyltransferase [Brachybacterium sacelli]|uniref:GNAT superfamily N-acetyltransferase n=1 Tax=Brachybacterium sacelli TaxID=173364 RepID=A0ABS4WVK4_9MICO|nr:GNAT family N-acetyltransferase [Brachybacterium sacelli]MBP2380232.1 GNAT superfamily N-acetyltransferase [Brachybacterium sacelli]
MDHDPVETAVTETFALRRRLLRADRTDLDLLMADDAVEGTFHLAVLDRRSAVGVVTVVPSAPEFDAASPAWRLRQMAVDPALQGTGIGSALFDAVVDRLRRRRAATLWAESRDSSLAFYLGRGMAIVPGREHTAGGVSYTDVALRLPG